MLELESIFFPFWLEIRIIVKKLCVFVVGVEDKVYNLIQKATEEHYTAVKGLPLEQSKVWTSFWFWHAQVQSTDIRKGRMPVLKMIIKNESSSGIEGERKYIDIIYSKEYLVTFHEPI